MNYIKDLHTNKGVGDVLKFKHKDNFYAMKFFTDHDHKTTSEMYDCEKCCTFQNELEMCECLRNNNHTIKVICCVSSEKLQIPNYESVYPGLMFPYYNYSLQDMCWGMFSFNHKDSKFKGFFKNMLKELNSIHKIGIIHSDIKPLNIMFNNFNEIDEDFVIIDFGNSIFKEDMMEEKDNPLTTSGYITPEMILGKPFDETIDVYALAITMINIYIKKDVFQGFNERTKKTKKIELFERKNYENIILNLGIKDYLLVDLLIKMLRYNKINRYSVRQCLNHIYFKKKKAPKKKKRTLPSIYKETGKKRKRKEIEIPKKKQKTK